MHRDPSGLVLLYDDSCPLCRRQMRALHRLDWLRRLSLRPISDPTTARLVPGLPQKDLMVAIHCIAADGQVYRGARALRHVGLRLPLLSPLALLLWIPGMMALADRVYAWVARNRYARGAPSS